MTISETPLVDILFNDLTYRKKDKFLLNGIRGQFKGGQLSGILGPSGAGKTTLLNILAGQIHFGTSGHIYINGQPRNNKVFHRISSYIMQDDIVQPRLSVKEMMITAANLKLDCHYTQREKYEIIEKVLISMGLDHCMDTRTENLSGGQKKRLCIAVELVNNPPVIFLDEPTTGLDEVSTKQCISLLKSLAKLGKTIICTIHQPSNTVFQLFDQVYFLADGNCVYNGTLNDMVPFLKEVGMPCPEIYNPGDYIIELVQIEKWATVLKNQNDKTSTIKIPEKSYKNYVSQYYEDNLLSYSFTVPFWIQFWILIKRKFLQIYRNKLTMFCEIGHHIFCSFIVGCAFLDRGKNAQHLVDNIKLYYGIIIYLMFSHGMTIALTFPTEVKLLQREYFNRWYNLKAYFLALNLSILPVSCIGTTIFVTIAYWLSGQPLELDRIALFLLISILYVIATQGFGLVIGSIFTPTNAACIGSVIGMILLLLSSYNMGAGEISNPFMKAIINLSYAYHGYVGLGTTAFRNREALDCPEIFCLFSDPNALLQAVGMEHSTVHHTALYLVVFTALHRLLAYGFLKCKLKPDSRLYSLLQ